jgi:AcrR family transcriptional regulator
MAKLAQTAAKAADDGTDRRIDRRRTNMRDRIKEASTKLFFQHGFEATSVRMIADACGITPGALYNHFTTKEELLFWIIESAIAQTEQAMQAALAKAESDPRSQLVAAVTAFVHFHAAHRLAGLLASAEYSSLPEPRLSQVKASRVRMRSIFEKIITAGQRNGQFRLLQGRGISMVRLVAIAMGDMCIRVAEWFDPEGAYSAEKMAAAYAELSLRLVGAEARS